MRDFIHVSDLADAHVLALSHILGSRENLMLNCGYGRGYSVRQVIDTLNQCLETPIKAEVTGRRSGDATEIVADCSKIRDVLKWNPKRDDLKVIVQSTLAWERGRH